MRARFMAVAALLIAGLASAIAQHDGHGNASPALGITTPTVTGDGSGRLWRAWVERDQVWVGSSTDRGRSWTSGVQVNPATESIDANGESRPKIVIGPRGEVYVSYTRNGQRPFTGDIRFGEQF